MKLAVHPGQYPHTHTCFTMQSTYILLSELMNYNTLTTTNGKL